MLSLLFGKGEKARTVPETSFSKFIRSASSGEKKRVYAEVLRKATDRQVKVLEQSQSQEHAAMAKDSAEQS